MRKIFVDMDGTVAKWETVTMRELLTPGYFYHVTPMQSMIDALEILHRFYGYDIYICSSTINEQCEKDKNMWINLHMPFVKEENRFFVPYGQSKGKFLETQNLLSGDLFIDDYSENLRDVKESCKELFPIKILNGINGTKKTWTGASFHYNQTVDGIIDYLTKISNAVYSSSNIVAA